MSARPHTPGAWTVLPEEVDKAYIRVRGTVLGSRFKVANVLHPSHEGSPAWEVEESRANARLIAAAPELLAMLQAVYDWQYGHGTGVACTEADMRELLAKATGSAA